MLKLKLDLNLNLNLNLNSGSQLSRMLYQSYLVPVLSLAGCYLLMQVRWVDQTQYPMIVVASLSAVPHSPAKSIFRLHVISSVHTHTHKKKRLFCSQVSPRMGCDLNQEVLASRAQNSFKSSQHKKP